MEYCLAQVLQKDVGKRLQVGQELIDYFSDKQKSADLEHDQTMLDKMVDGLATSWVNSSNYKVRFYLWRCYWSRMFFQLVGDSASFVLILLSVKGI